MDNRQFNEERFLTEEQETILHDYYFDEDNNIEEKLTEQGFRDWVEDISWDRVYDICGDGSREDLEDDNSEYFNNKNK
jgi:hypothetical protein